MVPRYLLDIIDPNQGGFMNISVIGIVLLAASAFAQEKMDYTHCNTNWALAGLPAGAEADNFMAHLNESGGFDVSSKHKSVSSFHRSDEEESVTVNSAFGGPMKYVLTKKDGRPVSMTTSFLGKANMPNYPGAVDYSNAYTKYAYVNSRCYVQEIGLKQKDGHDVITYDHEACNEVLAAVKGVDRKKIRECTDLFGRVDAALMKAKMRVEEKGNTLQLGLVSYPAKPDQGNASVNIAFGPLLAVSNCVFMRRAMGYELDKATADLMGMGGGFVGNPVPMKEDQEKERTFN